MNIGAPEFVWVGLAAFSAAYAVAKHGEPKKGSAAYHNGWVQLIGVGVSFGLLYWGGFFA